MIFFFVWTKRFNYKSKQVFLCFLCCPIMCLCVLNSVSVTISAFWFIFTYSCLQEDPCLIYVFCVCLHIVMSITYCVVFLFCLSSSCAPYVASFSGLFLFCFSSSCVPYVASFSGLSIFDCPFGILNAYLLLLSQRWHQR